MEYKNSLFVCLIIFLTACSPLAPVKVAEVKFYTLTNVSTQRLARTSSHKTLLVSQPTASTAYESSQMLYMMQPYQLRAFAKNQWIAAPTNMLLPLIVESLRHSHYFHAVVSPPFAGLVDYRLDVHLQRLQQNFINRPSQIEMAIQAELVNVKNKKIVASKRFLATVPCKQDNPLGGVIAANQAAKQILTKLSKFVVVNV